MNANNKGGASAPPPAQHVTPEWIAATLHKHFETGHNSGIELPPPSNWTVLAGRINNYIDNPWSNYEAADVTRRARQAQRDRETLDAAARILDRDRDRFPDTEAFAEFRRRWGEAIAVLRYPRSAADNPRDQLSRPVHAQQSPRAWTYTAREIIPQLVVGAVQSRATVKATPGNGIIKTLMDILRLIYPAEKLPSVPTFCKALKDDIDKYVRIAKTNP